VTSSKGGASAAFWKRSFDGWVKANKKLLHVVTGFKIDWEFKRSHVRGKGRGGKSYGGEPEVPFDVERVKSGYKRPRWRSRSLKLTITIWRGGSDVSVLMKQEESSQELLTSNFVGLNGDLNARRTERCQPPIAD